MRTSSPQFVASHARLKAFLSLNLCVIVAHLAQSQVTFYQTPFNSAAAAAVFEADFNGDGKADLLTIAGAVLLGNGNGRFTAGTPVNLPSGTTNLAVADFNGDGIPDILADEGFNLSVLLGNGNGTFQAPKNTYTALTLSYFEVADVNNDGKLDVIGLNVTNLVVYLGNGDGTFSSTGQQYATGLTNPNTLVTGDFNGDGSVDVALAFASTFSVLLGNGGGTFQSAKVTTLSGVQGATVLTNGDGHGDGVGDFNGDGKLDLVIGNTEQEQSGGALQQTLTLLGNGDGTFQQPGDPVTVNSPSIAFADLNGDGILDMFVGPQVSIDTQFAQVFLGNGSGGFNPGQSDYLAFNAMGNIIIADFNNDGKPDAAAGGAMLLGNGNGTFHAAAALQPGGNGAATADFNGDGKPDIALVASTALGDTLDIYLGDGTGQFTLANTYAPPGPNVTEADMNADGKPDLIFAYYAPGNTWDLAVLLGKGDGGFGAPIVTGGGGGAPLPIIAIADFNGDGKPDVAAIQSMGAGNAQQTLEAFLGDGDGTFGPQTTYFAGYDTNFLVAEDFNGDGKIDLAVSSAAGLAILLGNGDGTFQAASFPVVTSLSAFATADLNNDGKADILANGTVLLGNGNGTFTAISQPNVKAGVLADLNGDGILDLATSGYVVLGDGDGTFGVPIVFEPFHDYGDNLNFVASGDFNLDGKPDLVASVGLVGEPFGSPILLNTTVAPAMGLSVPSGSSSATVAAGSNAKYSLSIGGAGWSGTATLTCTGAPTGAVCIVPAMETVNATSTSMVAVSVTTTARITSALNPANRRPWEGPFSFGILGLMALLRRDKKKFGRAAKTALFLPLLLVILTLPGCGGSGASSGSGTNPNGTLAGTYPLTITATGAGVTTQNVTLTLVVQ
jgi:hypothetical protein